MTPTRSERVRVTFNLRRYEILPHRWYGFNEGQRLESIEDFDTYDETGIRFLGRNWFVRKVRSS